MLKSKYRVLLDQGKEQTIVNWNEYIARTGTVPRWPYPVNYGKENVIESDVLILGGGVAGCRAAIAARQKGVSVVLVDRGFTKRSGEGGTGVDHWNAAVKNPCSKVTPEMYTEAAMDTTDGFTNGPARYIVAQEGWDTLLEAEQMGVQIRDEDNEFQGSIFRDEETKLLFAYDIEHKHNLRIFGYNIKACISNEMRRLGTKVYERICVTSLLTKDGQERERVIGATGISDRTGEFYIFKAKAVVICTGRTRSRLWDFAPEMNQSQAMGDLNNVAMGHTIGWRAGAEFVMMEQSITFNSGLGYAPYSVGNNNNTYMGVPTVDSKGSEIHYAYPDGRIIEKEEEIFKSGEDGSFIIGHGIALDSAYKDKYKVPMTEKDLWKRVASGELQQPFYSDFTRMSDTSRRIVFNLMLAHEGKCRVPIYKNFTAWGFDPEKDMLQYPVGDYSRGNIDFSSAGVNHSPANWRIGLGGFLVDWRMQTSLPGMFAAGAGPVPSSGNHGESQTIGRYAGRQAAAFAKRNEKVEPAPEQIAKEKARVYAAVSSENGVIGWKEFNYAVARIMQDYGGNYKTEHTLDMGIRRMRDLLSTEGEQMYARNPHELARVIESLSLAELGIAYLSVYKARKASVKRLGFFRYDYPEYDESGSWNPVHQENGEPVSRFLSVNWHLQEPYAPTYEENYRTYGEIECAEGERV